MPIGSQVIYNAGDLILSTVSSSGNTFLETKISAATSSVILFNNSASLTSASLNSLTVGNAISSSYALTASFALNAGGGSGTVSGSTNYIAKFISSTSVGTSSIYETGSNVGIGTNVLPNKLTIDGNVTASSYTSSIVNAVGFLGTASYALTASAVSIVPANVFVQNGNSFGTTATLGTNDASALIFETNNVGRVTIDTNGYVGIAQPTPTAYLHVGQNTASDTNNYGIRIDKNGTLGSPGTYQNSAIYLSDLAGDGPSTVDVVGQVSLNFPRLQASDLSSSKVSHLIIAHDSALGPMRVDGKGNLWVGYDRNAANTSSNSFSTLIYGGLTVGSGYQTTTVSDGTAIFSGNVGIGTYNPQFLLDVSGSSRFGFTSSNTHQFTGSVNINGSLFSNANITASNISASRTGSFSIVGVGTTSPAAKLAVGSNPTYAAGVTLIVGTPGNPSTSGTAQPYANLRLGTNTGNSQVLDFGIYDASPYGSWIQAAGGGNLAFPSPLVLNPTGGSLGIGTSNPVATLDIENAVANIPVLNLGGGIGGENVSDLYVLNSYNANTGVGYSAKVIGVNISGSLTAQNIPVQRTVWSGVTSATAIVLGADGPRQGTQDNAFQIWTTSEGTSGSLLTQKFSLTSTGDVGIGTTAPAFLLDVSGSSRHGYRAADTHQFTGSVSISDGLSITNLTASNISASGYIIASRITSSNVLINGNLTVTGSIFASLFSASYIYITSSTLVVTDNIITLNALSPYQRYAGIEMYDSGSGNLSSFLWDGQGDYFFITGSGINSKVIGGPDQQGNLTSGRLTKATGTNIIGDSIVSEDGSGITVSGYISGSSVMTANITCSNISASKTGSFGIVGIGTSSPISKLEVSGGYITAGNRTSPQGAIILQGAYDTGNIVVFGSEYSSGGPFLGYGVSPSTASAASFFSSTPASNLGRMAYVQGSDTHRWYVGAAQTVAVGSIASLSEAMRINSSGYVGIGTTNPSYLLHLKGGGIGVDRSNISSTAVTPILSVKMSGSGAVFNDIISIQNSTSADQSNLIIGHANGLGQSTFIGAGESATYASNLTGWGGEYLYLGADEGVVAVTNLQSGPAAAYYPFTISPNGSIRMQYQWSGSSWSGASDSYALNVSGSNTQGLLYLQSPTAQNALFVSGSGNVGIGTTSPVQLLELRKTSASAIALLNYNDTVKLNLNASSGNAGYVGMVTNHPLIFVTNDTEKVRIDTSGNVGIGTSSPSFLLDVSGSSRHGFTSTNVHQFTGSVNISGSVNLAGSFVYDNAVLMDFGRTTTPAISTNYVVLQNITGSYNSAFFDYFASSASNFRAGTVIAGWSGSSINYTEYATTDIGNTNQLTMSVDLSSSFVRLLTTVSTTTNWNIKSSGRYL